MYLKNKINRNKILNSFELMQYYLNNISNLQLHIKCKIEELESKESDLQKDINLHKLKSKLNSSNIELEKYKNINQEIELKFKYSLSFNHSKERIIISILNKYGYDQKQIIQKNKHIIGELLTCQHRLYRLINSLGHVKKLSGKIKRKIAQELIFYCQHNQEENRRIRKAEKAALFMNIIGEIEKKACQDHLTSMIELQELNERIEQIFITKKHNNCVVKTKENNLTLIG